MHLISSALNRDDDTSWVLRIVPGVVYQAKTTGVRCEMMTTNAKLVISRGEPIARDIS